MRPMTRIEPKLPAHIMKTYAIAAPKGTHWVKASCADFGCAAHRSGWETKVDESTALGKRQAHYIRTVARRGHRERREAGLTVFTFAVGTECFQDHQVRSDRPELFLVIGGDHRGNPRGDRVEHTPENWVDDFATHQQRLTRAQE